MEESGFVYEDAFEPEENRAQPEEPKTRPVAEREDGPLFPDGPLRSQVASWTKQFGEVYITELRDDVFIWRPLSRYEYKMIVATPNTDPLMREEMICEQCVLWPEGFNYEKQSGMKAGLPAMLAEQIMDISGFNRDSVVTRRL